MSNTDGITDEIRRREEEYFRRKDRELIARMREAECAAKLRAGLESETGIHDSESLAELEELGFTPDTCALLPLIPLLQVAWAQDGVSAAERTAIVNLARSRGIDAGSPADLQLTAWLDHPPSPDTFAKATRLIAAMMDPPGTEGSRATAEELIKECEAIAHASGGMFGIGAVSAAERKALEQIAAKLRNP
ncbi:MAG TPA: hypothetical protein VNJ03_04040 [Vicinamibacterales bacterium]|nr:hypothetical protein [Vicinamibacterales bacterium]